MNRAAWLFVVIVGGYVLFELTLLHKLGYRMEVDHVLGQMVPGQRATERCGVATERQAKRFERRFGTLATRAARELAAANPQATVEAGAEQFLAQVDALRRATDETIDRLGCDSKEVAVLLRRYTIYAGRR